MKEIELTQGKVAIVDDDDYEWLNQWKWHFHNGYAVRTECEKRKFKTISMHAQILGWSFGVDVDHLDLNKLNNTRSNLRKCTHSQNQHNRSKYANNISGYKGVFWHKHEKKWQAAIKANGKIIYLGYYADAQDAARAYDAAALKYHGEFARLNFQDVTK
jgi:hypothetical protein